MLLFVTFVLTTVWRHFIGRIWTFRRTIAHCLHSDTLLTIQTSKLGGVTFHFWSIGTLFISEYHVWYINCCWMRIPNKPHKIKLCFFVQRIIPNGKAGSPISHTSDIPYLLTRNHVVFETDIYLQTWCVGVIKSTLRRKYVVVKDEAMHIVGVEGWRGHRYKHSIMGSNSIDLHVACTDRVIPREVNSESNVLAMEMKKRCVNALKHSTFVRSISRNEMDTKEAQIQCTELTEVKLVDQSISLSAYLSARLSFPSPPPLSSFSPSPSLSLHIYICIHTLPTNIL